MTKQHAQFLVVFNLNEEIYDKNDEEISHNMEKYVRFYRGEWFVSDSWIRTNELIITMEKHTIVDAVDAVLFMPAEGRPAEGKYHVTL